MKIGALSPYFGGNRMGAAKVGQLLAGCKWVGIPFAGGMSEVAEITARTVAVNDLHRHVINLARCVARPELIAPLVDRLEGTAFHPDALADSQRRCMAADLTSADGPDLDAAYHYFVCAWMARNGTAGTAGEFKAGFSMRWEAGGGDSAVRFRNAGQSLDAWHRIMRRCTFTTLDCFDFLDNCKDEEDTGIYADAPWPDDGYKYRHPFTEQQQQRLAEVLTDFRRARVVVRFGDHPLIRRLYPDAIWDWNAIDGRTSANKAKAEVLLVRRRSASLFPGVTHDA
jgi:site-specific DNA-adenine methylase